MHNGEKTFIYPVQRTEAPIAGNKLACSWTVNIATINEAGMVVDMKSNISKTWMINLASGFAELTESVPENR